MCACGALFFFWILTGCCLSCFVRFMTGAESNSEESIEMETTSHHAQNLSRRTNATESVDVTLNRGNRILNDAPTEEFAATTTTTTIFIGPEKVFISNFADPSSEEKFSSPAVATLVGRSILVTRPENCV